MDMPDETTGTLNGASTSVPEPTAAAVQTGTAIIPAPDGTTLTLNEAATNSFFQSLQGQHVTVITNGGVYNATNVAGNINNYNGESQTMYTGGGAPNGTGGL